MNYNRIDILDDSYGNVWQGGAVDDEIDKPPFAGPLLVVCMDKGESNEQFIDHTTVEAVLAVWIEDSPDACLKDNVLKLLGESIVAWLKNKGNVYVHCAAGVSRASYIDITVHCTALGISADQALAEIRKYRSIAHPNSGFLAQLQRLWPST